VLVLALAGCPHNGAQQAADPDSRRDKAEVVPLGGSSEDALNVKSGDASDWKAIDVTEPGKLRLVVTFGNPSCFCQVELLDPGGKVVSTHKDIGSHPRIELIIDKATPGRYLLHFSAKYEGDF